MIVGCPNCKVRFKIDDHRIRQNGSKVRCSLCRHIFMCYPSPHLKPLRELDGLINNFTKALNQVLESAQAMEVLYPKHQIPQPVLDTPPPLSVSESPGTVQEELKPQVMKLLRFLEQNDLQAEEQLDEFKTHFITLEYYELMEKLEDHISRLEFMEAIHIVKQIAQRIGISLSGDAHE